MKRAKGRAKGTMEKLIVQDPKDSVTPKTWIPASAGMTGEKVKMMKIHGFNCRGMSAIWRLTAPGSDGRSHGGNAPDVDAPRAL
jgi:hypothetical protein